MFNTNINNHFYNYVLANIDSKIYKFKQITSKKAHEDISKLSDFQNSLIISPLFKHCPIIYRRIKVSLPLYLNLLRL